MPSPPIPATCLANAYGITDNAPWRGFVITSGGGFSAVSHFNKVDSSYDMKADLASQVEQSLKAVGLVN
jgi:hypothetical protein